MTAGTAYFIASPPWATTTAGPSSSEDPAQSEGDTGVESLSGVAACGMPEGQVDLYLGRAVEEAEQAVADDARLLESVDQNARRALRTSAPRRGNDVHDQRSAILPEMRRHLRVSSPLF